MRKLKPPRMIMKSQLEWLVQPRTKAFNQYKGLTGKWDSDNEVKSNRINQVTWGSTEKIFTQNKGANV